MLSILRSRTAQLVISNVSKQIKNTAPFSTILVKFVNDATLIRPNIASLQYQHVRFKSKKKKNKAQEEETETEEEEHDKDDVIDKHTKVLNASVSSMRLDLILKSGLGMARNKVETLFYESKIRLNGQKVLKKSETVSIGDEIDVVKGKFLALIDTYTLTFLINVKQY